MLLTMFAGWEGLWTKEVVSDCVTVDSPQGRILVYRHLRPSTADIFSYLTLTSSANIHIMEEGSASVSALQAALPLHSASCCSQGVLNTLCEVVMARPGGLCLSFRLCAQFCVMHPGPILIVALL